MGGEAAVASALRTRARLCALYGGMLFAVSMGKTAHALPISKLVMPGPLIQGHADLEEECMKCHVPFERGLQTSLCLDCHKDVAADIRASVGYHGRVGLGAKPKCSRCHADHKGRDADIVVLDRDTLDHSLTDFPLVGLHRELACQGCHLPDVHLRETPSQCIDCHRSDDHHRGEMGEKCAQCHTPNGWDQAEFDHDTTKFALRGAHAEVSCDQCHGEARYENTPSDCASCHLLDDVHGGRHGRKCGDCHQPSKWKQVSFEHDRETDFELVGRHREVRCYACHKSNDNVYETDLDRSCVSCHGLDDPHKRRNGDKCESCHTPNGWAEVGFDHGVDTDFALVGKHVGVSCRACHPGDLYKDKPATDCYSCHRTDDPHDGRQGQRCDECHVAEGWGSDVFFDHDITRFPLEGLHALAPCEACHVSAVYRGTSRRCAECHQEDEPHGGALGSDCARCHNPNAWDAWIFDHQTDTDFALDGSHEGLACAACHTHPAAEHVEQSAACYACHRLDDAHRGAFGRLCASCHVTSSFKELHLR